MTESHNSNLNNDYRDAKIVLLTRTIFNIPPINSNIDWQERVAQEFLNHPHGQPLPSKQIMLRLLSPSTNMTRDKENKNDTEISWQEIHTKYANEYREQSKDSSSATKSNTLTPRKYTPFEVVIFNLAMKSEDSTVLVKRERERLSADERQKFLEMAIEIGNLNACKLFFECDQETESKQQERINIAKNSCITAFLNGHHAVADYFLDRFKHLTKKEQPFDDHLKEIMEYNSLALLKYVYAGKKVPFSDNILCQLIKSVKSNFSSLVPLLYVINFQQKISDDIVQSATIADLVAALEYFASCREVSLAQLHKHKDTLLTLYFGNNTVNSKFQTVKFLIDRGVDIFQEPGDGNTAEKGIESILRVHDDNHRGEKAQKEELDKIHSYLKEKLKIGPSVVSSTTASLSNTSSR